MQFYAWKSYKLLFNHLSRRSITPDSPVPHGNLSGADELGESPLDSVTDGELDDAQLGGKHLAATGCAVRVDVDNEKGGKL